MGAETFEVLPVFTDIQCNLCHEVLSHCSLIRCGHGQLKDRDVRVIDEQGQPCMSLVAKELDPPSLSGEERGAAVHDGKIKP